MTAAGSMGVDAIGTLECLYGAGNIVLDVDVTASFSSNAMHRQRDEDPPRSVVCDLLDVLFTNVTGNEWHRRPRMGTRVGVRAVPARLLCRSET
jgi:hypothetical protein